MNRHISSTRLADGGDIAWTHWSGSGSQSIVLIHGIGNQAGSWFGIPDLFAAQDWSITSIDLRGHGRSLRHGPFNVDQLATDVATVLQSQGIESPLLVGHSLGALVCTTLAKRNDIHARAVVNVDQALRLGDFAASIRMLWPYLKSNFADTIGPVFESMMPPELAPSIRESLSHEYATMNAAPAMEIWSPLVELDPSQLTAVVDQMLTSISVPYLALHGSDPGSDYAHWLIQRIPAAEVEVWDGARHFPHLLYPERFVSRVMQFATSV